MPYMQQAIQRILLKKLIVAFQKKKQKEQALKCDDPTTYYFQRLYAKLTSGNEQIPESDTALKCKDFITEDGRENITGYVWSNYVYPMLEAQKRDDILGYISLKQGLTDFFADVPFKENPFQKDVEGLCQLIDNGGRNPDEEGAMLYVIKMNAVHMEAYERAGKLRDQIERMIQQ